MQCFNFMSKRSSNGCRNTGDPPTETGLELTLKVNAESLRNPFPASSRGNHMEAADERGQTIVVGSVAGPLAALLSPLRTWWPF
jgi:hypothetical protein